MDSRKCITKMIYCPQNKKTLGMVFFSMKREQALYITNQIYNFSNRSFTMKLLAPPIKVLPLDAINGNVKPT